MRERILPVRGHLLVKGHAVDETLPSSQLGTRWDNRRGTIVEVHPDDLVPATEWQESANKQWREPRQTMVPAYRVGTDVIYNSVMTYSVGMFELVPFEQVRALIVSVPDE